MYRYIIFLMIPFLLGCGENKTVNEEIKVEGYAQGTTYHINYISATGINYQRQIDSLLIVIDNSMSTYNESSLISKWNKSEHGIDFSFDKNFSRVFNLSYDIYKLTEGAFDPTVGPLVNAWGFGFENTNKMDSSSIDSIMQFVGFNHIKNGIDNSFKDDKRVILDFNAIAQGYTVDVLSDFLKSNGITNYMVEVGGELLVSGKNIKNELWRIGIDKPIENLENREIQAIVNLNSRALATSGNYRKFYKKDGVKYSHTINPKTGFPVQHSLLSATVIANDCASADAFATTFMVMGLEGTKEFLKTKIKGLDVLLIYADGKGELKIFMTEEIKAFIELNPNN